MSSSSDSYTPKGIYFEEIEGSPTFGVDENGIFAKRIFKVNWNEVDTFLTEIMGQFSMQDDVGDVIYNWVPGAVITAGTPIAFPNFPNAFPVRATAEPFQPETPDDGKVSLDVQTNTYLSETIQSPITPNGAKVTVYYETHFDTGSNDRVWGFNVSDLPITPPPGTYLTYGGRGSGQVLAVPGRTFKWLGTNDQLSEDLRPGIIIPCVSHKIIWHRVIAPPWQTLADMIGSLNNALFLSQPAGNIMFVSYEPFRTPWYQIRGTLWRVEMEFAQQSKSLSDTTPVGWNYLYKEQALLSAVTGLEEHWAQIVTEDTEETPHPERDFLQLFAYGS